MGCSCFSLTVLPLKSDRNNPNLTGSWGFFFSPKTGTSSPLLPSDLFLKKGRIGERGGREKEIRVLA